MSCIAIPSRQAQSFLYSISKKIILLRQNAMLNCNVTAWKTSSTPLCGHTHSLWRIRLWPSARKYHYRCIRQSLSELRFTGLQLRTHTQYWNTLIFTTMYPKHGQQIPYPWSSARTLRSVTSLAVLTARVVQFKDPSVAAITSAIRSKLGLKIRLRGPDYHSSRQRRDS